MDFNEPLHNEIYGNNIINEQHYFFSKKIKSHVINKSNILIKKTAEAESALCIFRIAVLFPYPR